MSEWGSYRLSDFLLFSAQTYYRLFELYNRDIWPLQIPALAGGVAIAVLLFRKSAWQGRAISAILAASWLWVAWAFHRQHYASIHWAAAGFAVGFAVEALLLIWKGVIRDRLMYEVGASTAAWIGLGVFMFALCIQPFMALYPGRQWLQMQIFGVAPDPTALATLGLLLLAGHRGGWILWIVPVLWCGISGATLWALESPEAFLPPAVAVVTLLLATGKAVGRRTDRR